MACAPLGEVVKTGPDALSGLRPVCRAVGVAGITGASSSSHLLPTMTVIPGPGGASPQPPADPCNLDTHKKLFT
jgi:hypothetical protein